MTSPNLSTLEGKRILVTGGAGLIGSHITDLLVDAGTREVVIFDDLSRGRVENLASASERGNVTVVEGDVRDRNHVRRVVENADAVIHLAAIRLTQCAEEPRLALEIMADGAFNVIEAAAELGRRIVAASSASTYGMAEVFPTSEKHHPYDNDTIYGATKTFNEGLLRSFAVTHGLHYVALRPFNVYGPRMDIHGAYTEVLVRWMERIAAGKAPIIFGDGSQSMDFIYVEDVARAFVTALASEVDGDVFNAASGTETTLKELAEALLQVMHSDLPIEYGPERKINPVPRRLADISKAQDVLGFEAEIGLHEGLQRLVEWWAGQTGWTRQQSAQTAI